QREEPGRAGRVHQRRHGDECVRGVQVAAEQEPADEGAEATPAEAPLVQVQQALGPAPAGGPEADEGNDDEQDDEDGERDRVDVSHSAPPASSGRVPGAAAACGPPAAELADSVSEDLTSR